MANLIETLAALAKKNRPTWRTEADPELVAEVYRRTNLFSHIERWLDGFGDVNALLRHLLTLEGDVVVAYIAEQDAEMEALNEALANNY